MSPQKIGKKLKTHEEAWTQASDVAEKADISVYLLC
jgi:hypothetical protein